MRSTKQLLLPVTQGGLVQQCATTRVSGVLCRDGTYDASIVKSVRSEYGWMSVRGKTVLDIGGNIGAYARLAAELGAKKVISVEPEESNFSCLLANTRDLPCIAPIRGIVGPKKGVGSVYISESGKNPGNTSSVPMRGRTHKGGISVVAFDDLLREHAPAVIKIDCEGAEYEFLTKPLPAYVQEVTIELHLSRASWRTAAENIKSLFAGWEVVTLPRLEGASWHTIGAWRRASKLRTRT